MYPGHISALRDVNLTIGKGDFVFLMGPSGAGKTTLFRLISAYDRPTSGEVTVAGYDIGAMDDEEIPYFRRRIGVVYQDFRLIKSKNVIENVSLPLTVRGDRASFVDRRAKEVLEQVGLNMRMHHYPEQLSGGEQQRVAIARALIHQPGILIADEPTGNLDPELSQEIMELFDRVNAQGTTIFIATHDHELVHLKTRRVVNIRDGEILR